MRQILLPITVFVPLELPSSKKPRLKADGVFSNLQLNPIDLKKEIEHPTICSPKPLA